MNEGKRIIYIEDQSDASVFHIEALKDEGYDLTVTAKEDEIFVLHEKPFDLLILDIMIKTNDFDIAGDISKYEGNLHFNNINWDETGLEFLKKVRSGEYEKFGIQQNIHCIVVTAVGDVDVQEKIYKFSPKALINKPYRIQDLLREVKLVFCTKGDNEQ